MLNRRLNIVSPYLIRIFVCQMGSFKNLQFLATSKRLCKQPSQIQMDLSCLKAHLLIVSCLNRKCARGEFQPKLNSHYEDS